MHKSKSFSCLIAARGGSTRLPNKNIKMLNGRELIRYTLNAADESGVFDKKMVSSDNQQILDLGYLQKSGWESDKRPDALSTAESMVIDTVKRIITMYPGMKTDYLMLLSPTNPLRNAVDIKKACDIITEKNCDVVYSVSPCTPKQYHGHLNPDGSITFLNIKNDGKQVQDYKQCYKLSGAIVLAKIEVWKDKTNIWDNTTVYPVIIERDVEIDTQLDFDIAEALERKIHV